MLLNCGVGEDSWDGLQGDQTVNPKGNQSWIFIGRTDAEAETSILWPPDEKGWLIRKRPWCWEILKAGEGDDRGWDGWMDSLIQWHEFDQAPRDGEGQGSLVCCSPWGRKELDITEWLNNNKCRWEWQGFSAELSGEVSLLIGLEWLTEQGLEWGWRKSIPGWRATESETLKWKRA